MEYRKDVTGNILFSFLFCILLLAVMGSGAQGDVIPTSTWVDFFGNVTLDGEAAPIGTLIKAFDPQGVLCGEFIVHTAGVYGWIHVYGDNSLTPNIDEGASLGDTLTFYVNDFPATSAPSPVQWSGDRTRQEVNLSAISGFPLEVTKALNGSDARPIIFDVTGVMVEFDVGESSDFSGEVTVRMYDNPPPSAGGSVLPYYWDIISAASGSFLVTLSFSYTDEEVAAAGLIETALVIGRYDGTIWRPMPTTCDSVNNKLSTTTREFSIWGIGYEASLPVTLSSFTAKPSAKGVTLRWTTETETRHLGWNIYRSEKRDGDYKKINARLIRAFGNSNVRKSYEYLDEGVIAGRKYYYYLQGIDFNGNASKSKVISVLANYNQASFSVKLPTTWGSIKAGVYK